MIVLPVVEACTELNVSIVDTIVQIPNKYWTLETGIEATKWLVEEKLKLSTYDINKKLSRNVFNEYGLGGMLRRCFNRSVFKALNSTYPDRFKLTGN
ncbi:hypothetical protein [Clostridium sp. CF012]|uniref:hypothetical protein n=1 Tax=Clostridium sp. CF012 TaxID=2843319 RepID=UPI001C0B0434|nr:hypothetical protein [Clostridium sp. CF012]